MALRKTAGYLWNPISVIGMLLAIVATGLIIAFIAAEMITGFEHPYIGLLTYFAFPGMLITGLLIVPIGAWQVRQRRRTEDPEQVPPYPRMDFNDPNKRRLFIFFVLASIIFVLIVSVASILGFHFTESTTFCGELCHTVMEPEHTAWGNSPHARVRCVDCHVGPGAQWFVKAKISGLRQVWAVLAHTYPAPIENLRPARDTCEQCHWPEKFYAGRQKIFYHYAPNKENTPREVNMLINIGGAPKSPTAQGIHWHIGTDVFYVARDKKRLDIPYISVKQKDGSFLEYMTTEKPMTKEEVAKAKKRLMDCTDCHNRPTHIYKSPSQEVDEHIVSGFIDPSLPYIKKVSVELLEKPYKTKEEAMTAIEAKLPEYYTKNYPEAATAKAAAIKQAVEQVKDIYSRNFFPEMKVSWNTYPNHIGHFYTPGCFRCHDGKHKASNGKIISKDCAICHTVISQKQENIPAGKEVKAFIHPVDIGDELYTTNCSDCHAAGGEDVAGHGKH